MSEIEEQKPEIPVKSSNEILSELFNSFDADPPLIIKKEKDQNSNDDDDDSVDDNDDKSIRKNKKSKKKHKHKDKKHKKKDKKRKRSSSSERSEIDLAEILIKQEKELNEKKIKIEGTNLSFSLNNNNNVETNKEKDHNSNDNNNDKVIVNDNSNNKQKDKRIEVKLKTTNLDTIKSNNEDGELSDSDQSEHKKNKKHKHKSHRDKSKKKHQHRSRSSDDHKLEKDDLRNKLRENHNQRSRSREDRHKDDHHHHTTRHRSRERSRDKDKRDKSREHKSRERDRRNPRDNPFYRDEDNDRDYRWRKRYRSPDDRRHDRSNSHDSSSHIDKKKLLEIARKNAIQMMKSGNLPGALNLGPQAQEKVIAAIKAGGKTIEELTDFCKALSKKEEQDGLSSNTEDKGSDSEADVPFHHPFQIKDRPTSITMNIKNSVPLPLKSTQERTSELRIQFPVSSGQLHRKTENEWVPVPPKKTEPAAILPPPPPPPPPPPVPLPAPPAIVPAPSKNFVTGGNLTNAPPIPEPITEMAPDAADETNTSSVDIGAIVSQRLSAMRKLQENPNDVEALAEMYKSNKEMQTWAESKQQPGQFTGTTGAQILSQAELSSGFQTWAKKDQLQTATPVSGGMGMHLLQKMGWKPGEGLGKEKTGALEPLLLEVKLDKKGLVANEEQRKKKKQTPNNWTPNNLQNKHPVSLLGEYASKKKLGAPQYNLCFECGPDHKKNFLFQVILNGVEYKPNIASPTKKEAKAMAATVCLQHLGFLPPSS